jgi:catechol 2,3-dioxygenase-like lactoylglutathione lyase family enzyme
MMTASAASTMPVSVAVTGHIGLNVTDVARSTRFYRQVFGFELLADSTDDGRRYAFLGHGDQLVLTLWEQSRDRFAADRPGLHHLAFDVPALSDVEAAVARLHDLGVALVHDKVLAHMPGHSSGGIFFNDPDGIRIEICTAEGLESHPAPEDGAPSCGFF